MLEIYVVWHPGDDGFVPLAEALIDHFHGNAFSGLIGGAVEVFVRCEGWEVRDGAPRPLPFMEPLLQQTGGPDLTVVLPLMGVELARSVESEVGGWRDFVEQIVASRNERNIEYFPIQVQDTPRRGRLNVMFDGPQRIRWEGTGTEAVCRDIAQAICQFIEPSVPRLTVFVSHTKVSDVDHDDRLTELIDRVRYAINNTRLSEFFDARDLQPGCDWVPELLKRAKTSALLVIRTDLYATRAWCQREVLTAKRAGMPVVTLDALFNGEDRGSFLMDHVPRLPSPSNAGDVDGAILRALAQVVDESLKRVLWKKQQVLAARGSLGLVSWWAPQAPEPLTFVDWLRSTEGSHPPGEPVVVLHPDPPLGPDELQVLQEIASLSGLDGRLEILTPRGLSARGT